MGPWSSSAKAPVYRQELRPRRFHIPGLGASQIAAELEIMRQAFDSQVRGLFIPASPAAPTQNDLLNLNSF